MTASEERSSADEVAMTEKRQGDAEATAESKTGHMEKPPLTETVVDVDDGNSEDVQAGVKGIEAAASVWTKTHLVLAYGM